MKFYEICLMMQKSHQIFTFLLNFAKKKLFFWYVTVKPVLGFFYECLVFLLLLCKHKFTSGIKCACYESIDILSFSQQTFASQLDSNSCLIGGASICLRQSINKLF